MAFMGYETPVEIPSMGVYDTDLMKMYIAGVKDQYEKGQEEMKDFMKQYADFYSPIAGDTEKYNQLTIGGAGDMINQMMAAGIDPYKSPEARAAISRYIASRPTGVLNAMKRNAENRKIYDQAVAQARLSGKYDPEYEAWALKQAKLDNFSTIGPNGEIRIWDRLAPNPKQEWADVAAPYLKEFNKTEKLDSDVKGYTKWGVSDSNKKAGIDAVMNAANSTPWLQYKLQQAYDRTAGLVDTNGNPLSEEQRTALAIQDVRKQAENTAAQYYQPEYKIDEYAKEHFAANERIRVHAANRNYDLQHPTNPNPSAQTEHPSYGHTMYYQGIGKLFGLDVMSTSQYISDEKNLIGKNIAAREDALMKNRRTKGAAHAYDFKGVISDHTSHGDAQSNMELLGLSGAKPRSASVQVSTKNSSSSTPKLVTVGTLRSDQIQLDGEIKSRMVSDYTLVQSNAGYAASKHSGERYGFATNKKNAKYATVTDKVVTQLSKNGRVEQYVKVILHDDHNNVIDSAYILAQRSMQTAGGQSYTMRNMYGSEQNVQLDVVSDYGGRHVKDAKATQRYMNRSKKDSNVYESGDDSEDEYEDE